MSNQKAVKQALLLPLIGLTLGWLLFMATIWSNLYVPMPAYDESGNTITEAQVQLSTYLFLLGIAAFSLFALLGQRKVLAIRRTDDSPLAKSVHRATNLAVILSLVAGAIYAIGNFLGAFNSYSGRDVSPLVRIFGVYVPIVLATILVVAIVLLAFVFRKDAPDLASSEPDDERKQLQRYVGLAYASPIIGTAIAVILGLAVYDVTRTNLDVWIWVVIQAIIATSILLGTRFAAKVRLSKPLPPKPRQSGLAAVNLNLVLAIVFGATVVIMSFSYGAGAFEELRTWPAYEEGVQQQPTVELPDLTWWASKMLPAIVLLALAEFGIYRSIVVRYSEEKLA
jgi:MFS family permease